ncbi:DUF3794 domain-containing protein [Pelosinus baikalensis]|uniref:DUF3794 domain-containing protein n=1 Tax=Pelosinus baikalensis TaxID=2892015 RepID=A0ABS8HZD7_9FIRM|nr:DUF3794 domain-containing protein [Pelosinus baikalensis]
MDEKDTRLGYNQCTLGTETGPQTIIVRQVIGAAEEQKVLDIHVVVPDRKPAIEQIVDVFVKDVCIDCVDVIHNKVIVRGEFEIKAIYVAYLPDQPVHAVEIKHFKWTQDIEIPGARRGMDADANVIVEFVDYDVDCHSRAYKYKYGDYDNCNDGNCKDHHHHHDHDDCDDDCDDHCDDHHDDCDDHHHHHHHRWTREFDVSVVLKIVAKVMADRQVQIGGNATMPTQPKG